MRSPLFDRLYTQEYIDFCAHNEHLRQKAASGMKSLINILIIFIIGFLIVQVIPIPEQIIAVFTILLFIIAFVQAYRTSNAKECLQRYYSNYLTCQSGVFSFYDYACQKDEFFESIIRNLQIFDCNFVHIKIQSCLKFSYKDVNADIKYLKLSCKHETGFDGILISVPYNGNLNNVYTEETKKLLSDFYEISYSHIRFTITGGKLFIAIAHPNVKASYISGEWFVPDIELPLTEPLQLENICNQAEFVAELIKRLTI